jgi:serine protease Do
MNQIIRKTVAIATLGVGLGAGATVMSAVHDPIRGLDAQAPARMGGPGELTTAFRDVSKAVLPAVVYVEVQAQPKNVSRQLPDEFRGTPFEQFFGGPDGPQGPARPQRGSGSGFIVSGDGYIITNNHVVEDATRVTVTLTDKREFEAKVVGRDPNTDVAVLKIEAKGLPTVRLGNVDSVQVGDWVLALGYPMSLGETVTAGIVSAKGRNIGIMEKSDTRTAPLEHFIQTDAAINPGNSGGPLVNLNGEVIGINTAIASPTGAYAGYGFAVPVSLAKRVADDLIRDGVVHRPKLGVSIKEVTLADAEVFGLKEPRGAVVGGMVDGPARDAGMRMGDVIVAVAGHPVEDPADLQEQIALRKPGETVSVDIVRYGERKQVNIRLGTFDNERAATSSAAPTDASPLGRLGFGAQDVTPEMARQMGLKNAGVVVVDTDPMGPAAAAHIGRGLQIESLNGKQISSVDDLRKASEGLKPGSTVSIVGRIPDGTETIINYRIRG